MIQNVACISHLFNLNANTFIKNNGEYIGFYSMKIMSATSFRSQTAYDVHNLIRRALSGSASVILFEHNNQFMLSLQGYDTDVYLSDWYSMYDDSEILTERIHIGNISLITARECFYDLIYCCARKYFIYSISGKGIEYDLFPVNYFKSSDSITDTYSLDKEELKHQIQALVKMPEIEYGDDYVEIGSAQNIQVSLGAEFDLITFDLETDDYYTGIDTIKADENEDVDSEDESESYNLKDSYEFDYVDDEVFQDPILMLKWLSKN